MAKELCILHGNCQGDALGILLGMSEPFSRHFEIKRVVNYLEEPLDPRDLERCSLFLYQYLAPRWGASATGELLKRLPPGCHALCFPNMFFNGCWPFWMKAEEIIEFADSLLEKLLAMGLPPADILRLYQKCPFINRFNKCIYSNNYTKIC